jgi:Protein of unknown function (DUF3096)
LTICARGERYGGNIMELTITTATIAPLVALVAGILILVMPRLLNYIVAIYLILVGLLGLFPNLLA